MVAFVASVTSKLPSALRFFTWENVMSWPKLQLFNMTGKARIAAVLGKFVYLGEGFYTVFFFLFLVLFLFFSSFHLYHSEYYMWFRIVTWLGCHPLQLRHFISLLIFASKHSPYPNLSQFLFYPISIWIQIDFLVDLPSLRK